MKRAVHHQSQNTTGSLLTTYRYDHTSNPGPIGIPHFHKNYEILIPTLGQTDVTVDGKRYTVRPGQAMMVHPFQTHYLHLDQSSRLWCSVFSASLVGGLCSLLEGMKPKNPVFRPSEGSTRFFLEEMMTYFGAWNKWEKLTVPQKMAAKAGLYAIGCEYLSQVELVPDRMDDRSENLAAAVAAYIAAHFKNNLSLEQVAKALGYSYQHLSKTFHGLFGMNFKRLLNQYRMEHAMALVSETSLPLTQVAFESGFQSIRTFNHVWAETFQNSPSEIRQKIEK
ncbi:MAG: AraC family transcriptional regulator [Ruminococcaceae bacterium]|nr:AraC family transcriptional regulator [Oscillospiraceae bacterium]